MVPCEGQLSLSFYCGEVKDPKLHVEFGRISGSLCVPCPTQIKESTKPQNGLRPFKTSLFSFRKIVIVYIRFWGILMTSVVSDHL